MNAKLISAISSLALFTACQSLNPPIDFTKTAQGNCQLDFSGL